MISHWSVLTITIFIISGKEMRAFAHNSLGLCDKEHRGEAMSGWENMCVGKYGEKVWYEVGRYIATSMQTHKNFPIYMTLLGLNLIFCSR